MIERQDEAGNSYYCIYNGHEDAVEGKKCKVYDAGYTIGAKDGIQIRYMRVEISQDGTIHSSPINQMNTRNI